MRVIRIREVSEEVRKEARNWARGRERDRLCRKGGDKKTTTSR